MLRRLLIAALAAGLLAPAAASAATVTVQGGQLLVAGTDGDDTITVYFAPGDSMWHVKSPGVTTSSCTQAADEVSCAAAGVTQVTVDGGAGNDILSGVDNAAGEGPAPIGWTGGAGFDEITGGPSKDTIDGGGDADILDGGAGDDTLNGRDGIDERVNCGAGNDSATTDLHDSADGCEANNASGDLEPDADRDGFAKTNKNGTLDCNDADPNINPGKPEVAGDGVDNNCDGFVDRPAGAPDKDNDGFDERLDCNDNDPNIRPLGTEIIGNFVDEDCDGIQTPFPPLRAKMSTQWQSLGFRTRAVVFQAEDVPAGTTITMSCNGNKCPFKNKSKKIGKASKRVNLLGMLGRSRLRPRVKITVRFAKDRTVGKILRYRMVGKSLPTVEILCFRPGGTPLKNCPA